MTENSRSGCLPAILGLFRRPQENAAAPATDALPYRRRIDLLSPAELSFYHVLHNALGDRLVIFPKVSLKDIFFVARPQENRAYMNRINQKHVDFLLCTADALTPVLAVELDDASHQRAERAARDEFVERVFAQAGLPLLRFPARNSYDTRQIREAVEGELSKQQTPELYPAQETPAADPDFSKTCPQCGGVMVLRTSRRGPQAGRQFYGCSSYPNCRVVLPVEEQSG